MASWLMSQMATHRPLSTIFRCFIRYVPRLPDPMMPNCTCSLAAFTFWMAGKPCTVGIAAAAAVTAPAVFNRSRRERSLFSGMGRYTSDKEYFYRIVSWGSGGSLEIGWSEAQRRRGLGGRGNRPDNRMGT